MSSFITSLPSWILFLLVFIVGIAISWLGGWLTTKRLEKRKMEPGASFGALVGAMLGLLAFMLGLTYSITQSRFAERKHLVVQQAEIIGDCYLRTSLLPEKQKRESQRILSRYIDLLLAVRTAPDLEKGLRQLDSLHLQLWHEAASLIATDMDSELRSLYIASVNQVVNIFGERKTVALVFRIPTPIWIALLLLYMLSMFVLGSEMSIHRIRGSFHMPILAAAFALVVALIGNMDSTTQTSRFMANQQPLVDIQRMIQQEQTFSPAP
jgi:hypothetical protein